MAIPLILVAPGLLAQPPKALARVRTLQTLAGVADIPVAAEDATGAVLDALGMPPDTPIAPLLAREGDVGMHDYVIVAEPVLLVADRDDLVLVDRVDDLVADESAELIALLNRHFSEDGLHFFDAGSVTWLARVDRPPALRTTPVDIARRRGILPYLPTGPDARTWTRWQNEIQMLLHDHPVNVAREARGRVPVTGVWFWGGGRADATDAVPRISAKTVPNRIGNLVRAIARIGAGTHAEAAAGETLEDLVAASHGNSAIVVVGNRIDVESAIADFDAEALAPALSLLDRGAVDPLHVIADGNGGAARWTAAPPTLWRRFVARGRRKPFLVPDPPGS
jgi:hypothetical protein